MFGVLRVNLRIRSSFVHGVRHFYIALDRLFIWPTEAQLLYSRVLSRFT